VRSLFYEYVLPEISVVLRLIGTQRLALAIMQYFPSA
jgi:hypothetical protein